MEQENTRSDQDSEGRNNVTGSLPGGSKHHEEIKT